MKRKHSFLLMTFFLAMFVMALSANSALAQEADSPEDAENTAQVNEPAPAAEPDEETAEPPPTANEDTQERNQPASTRQTRSHRVSGGLTLSENPGLLLGISIGPGLQRITSDQAGSTNLEQQASFLLSIMADYGWQLGPGNLGLQVHGNFMGPNFYLGLGFTPRYMAEFILKEYLISIAPWAGWNFQFGGFNKDGNPAGGDSEFRFHFNSGLSLGVNLQFLENFYGTMQFDLNFIGTDASYWGTDYNYTNYLFKFGVAYRLM